MADGQISPRKPVRLADYAAPAFRVDKVALDFDLDPAATFVRATLKCRRQVPGPLVLDGKDLDLQSVTLHDVPDEFTLETVVKIAPDKNTELSGLYMSGSGFFTQCEPEGFRRITYF